MFRPVVPKSSRIGAVSIFKRFSSSDILDRKQVLESVPEKWMLSEDGKYINRSYQFKGFQTAWAFLTQVAMHSHLKAHHPIIYNQYKKVDLTLHTDDVGGLTDKDIKMAKRIEKFYELYST